MPLKTTPFDAARFLDTPESRAELIADALETGDASYITHALGVAAKAQGMASVAREAGVTREGLYKALSKDGDPRLTTLLGVVKSLGLSLTVQKHPPPAE